jgi:hypothetical protein
MFKKVSAKRSQFFYCHFRPSGIVHLTVECGAQVVFGSLSIPPALFLQRKGVMLWNLI